MSADKRLRPLLIVYIVSLCVVAGSLLIGSVIDGLSLDDPIVWLSFIALLLMTELGQLLFNLKHARVGLHVTESIMLPMLLALPFEQVIWTIAIVWILDAIRYRKSGLMKAAFNMASPVVAGAMSVGVVSLLMGSGGSVLRGLSAAAVGTFTYALATHLFVAIVIALAERRSVDVAIPQATLVNIGGGILLGLLFAAAYVATQWAVLLFPLSQIAITLGYQAVVKQSQERDRIQSLYRASSALAGTPDLSGALVSFLRAVSATASTTGAGAVLEYEGMVRKTVVLASHAVAVREPIEDGPYLDLLAAVRSERGPLMIDDDSSIDDKKLLDELEVRNLLAVPIMEAEDITGALLVTDRVGSAQFGDEEQNLLEAQAIELSMSLRSRRLFDEQIQAREENQVLQDQLRQAQKLESVGQLAGGIAHDFNNILAIIGNCSTFVLDELLTMDLTAEQRTILEDVREIKSAADRATKLTRQLLVFSRRDQIEEQVLDVNDVIDGLVKLLRHAVGEGVAIELHLNETGSVSADPGQIEQILLNLAINARDARSGSGSVVIRTGEVELDRAAVAHRNGLVPGAHVRIEVSDSGCGMSPAVKEKAFDPFFTTKAKGQGTGLGLSTVYGIVGRARGHIEMDSEEGRGTTFRIYLPVLADAPAAEEIRAPVVTGPQGSGETILLVEDEHAVRAVARRILATGGYQVIEAADGREALQVIASAETEVDLVLTDIVMPGMSGLDLDEAIRRLRPGTTTLFMTAYSEAVAFPDAVRGSLVVQKPFDSDTLLSTIHQVLSTATAA